MPGEPGSSGGSHLALVVSIRPRKKTGGLSF